MPSISVPTALAIASAAGGVASGVSGIMASNAAKSAGKTQAAAATNAVQLQQHMFDTIQQNLNPFMQVGQGAIPMLQGLLGVGGTSGAGTTGAQPGAQPGASAADGPTPGMLAVQAAGPHSKNPLTSGIGGALTGLGGGLGIGRKNASPLQDIYAATAKGIPIKDSDWAKAGFGPGGSAKGGTGAPAGPAAAPAGAGGNPLGATPFDPQSFLEKTPGYQFTKTQGLQATQNSYASHGLSESGAALKGAANYAEGLAGTTYEARLGDYFKLLEGGQSAATGLGQFGTSAGLNMGNTAMSGAAATAAGTVGSANALTGGITGVAGATGNFALSQALNGTGMFGNGGGGGNPGGFADTGGLGGFPAAYQG
jgi:hypothetical protein